MATDGDHEMADATAGDEANGANGDFVKEKQRLRLVWSNCCKLYRLEILTCRYSYQARRTPQRRLHLRRKITRWETLYVI